MLLRRLLVVMRVRVQDLVLKMRTEGVVMKTWDPRGSSPAHPVIFALSELEQMTSPAANVSQAQGSI